jgi:uncharacterized protein YhfF
MSTSPIEQFWQRYLASLPAGAPRPTRYQAWHFSASPAGADGLAELVKCGVKNATASLGWVYDWQKEPYPQPGDLSIITKWDGSPQCVIETTNIEVVPFDQVSAEFASEEGEGTRSLEEWRRVHWPIFSSECAIIEREPSLDMPVVCERFRLVYKEI